ncbi:MAG: hypothetical protein HQL15_09815 [Candidatus Omnitrophica bacterium]|nr:hypothetical protein [Candidatus Omnitrophota bacterium]
MNFVIIVLSTLMLTSCASLIVQKQVQVKKDANGKVIETIETESAVQRAISWRGLKFDHLKIKEVDSAPAAI